MSGFWESWEFLPFLLGGLRVTIEVTVTALLIAVPTAFILAFGRMSRFAAIRWVSATFVEVFRGTSALVQLFWAYYVLPFFGVELSPFLAGVLVLGLNEGSYFSEMVRPSLQSVLAGQRDACVSLHLPKLYRFFAVMLPQSLPVLIPPFANTAVDMLKFSSLVSLVTLQDLSYRASMVRSSTGASELVFGAVLVIYFLMSLGIVGVLRQCEQSVVRWAGRSPMQSDKPMRTSVPKWALGR